MKGIGGKTVENKEENGNEAANCETFAKIDLSKVKAELLFEVLLSPHPGSVSGQVLLSRFWLRNRRRRARN